MIRSWMRKRFTRWRPRLPKLMSEGTVVPKRGHVMIDSHDFAQKQMELATEFAKFVVDHPEVDAQLPVDSYIYFEVSGEPEFNQFSRQLAERRQREDGMTIVCVRTKGLTPPQGSRLVDPQIIPSPAVA